MSKEYYILNQYRNESSQYNDFVGKYYHYSTNKPAHKNKFENVPVEFVYFEPSKSGKGEYFGFGRVVKKPFPDKKNPDYVFVEIEDYKEFTIPVPESDVTVPNYNPQNAIQRITGELLNEICLDGGVKLNIESDAHLIKVLGEQLIGSEKVGVLELIKNSIDAQAS